MAPKLSIELCTILSSQAVVEFVPMAPIMYSLMFAFECKELWSNRSLRHKCDRAACSPHAKMGYGIFILLILIVIKPNAYPSQHAECLSFLVTLKYVWKWWICLLLSSPFQL
ncbi:hypothetical protein JMJ77_0006950 [Colletotrichum scovillei]|uniref:Uncharacterized protein n=1 Tax=Colletotrichum scovillei TaxID=1209932 RepID=A0A9P7REC3_9PEZI|nr:hypothetical protein JMJ77_0006950 [Colletotrichum scovillei]KAG7073910.1 hypothetical protein JMJ76_0010405 [Colletotrichum scovillei]KAG7081458.1 hypothetical protein JMJ78_0003581 [Colletotrichum scovillei]